MVSGLKILDESLEKAENPLRFGTLVVFTDGTDRAARVSEEQMRDALGDTKHDVFAIGLGAEISDEQLARIGKDGTAMAVDKESVVEAFAAVAERIEKITQSYYLLSYCSPARAGEHEVRIEAKIVEGDKERRGGLSTSFDAEGFDKGCDPNKLPKFDLQQGTAAQGEGTEGAERSSRSGKRRMLFKKD